ncbi:MAG: family acetyltransferase [Caulobacteraceae bacterium]|jgi:ribosomal protein S18 acetylase RimI-like enzyme|nr:family acetyltransferase [Caulobacteraceae bacterium]
MPPVIRRATAADAEALSALADRLFVQTFVEELAIPYPPADLVHYLRHSNGVDSMEQRLADPMMAVWLAEADGVAVGYAVAGPAKMPHPDLKPSDGMLNRLYVERDRKGAGLAPRLMDLAMAWLVERFGPRPWLSVYSGNLRAQRFYVRYGFEKCGEHDDPVGTWIDREFIMRRR